MNTKRVRAVADAIEAHPEYFNQDGEWVPFTYCGGKPYGKPGDVADWARAMFAPKLPTDPLLMREYCPGETFRKVLDLNFSEGNKLLCRKWPRSWFRTTPTNPPEDDWVGNSYSVPTAAEAVQILRDLADGVLRIPN